MTANALHIMPEPEKALREIHRVLKDQGFQPLCNVIAQKQ